MVAPSRSLASERVSIATTCHATGRPTDANSRSPDRRTLPRAADWWYISWVPRLFPGSRHAGILAIAVVVGVVAVLLWPTRSVPAPAVGQPAGLRAAAAPTHSATSASAATAPGDVGLPGDIVAPRPIAPPGGLTARLAEPPQPLPVARLTGYVWPLARGRITLPFKAIPGGTRIKDGHLWHDGVDIASFCGDHVRAAHAGIVLAAGRHFDDEIGWVGDLAAYYALLDRRHMWPDLPNVLIIDDGNTYRSVYAHMSRLTVHVGQRVRAGQVIGYEGATGHASGCHVHYGLFSPFETATFGVRADIVKRLRTPTAEIARIDPLVVLPRGHEALRTRRVPVHAAPDPRPAGATLVD